MARRIQSTISVSWGPVIGGFFAALVVGHMVVKFCHVMGPM
jgi:hypothetical protein